MLSRRQFLQVSSMTALLAGLPTQWVGRVFASDAPETPQIRIGIIALTDCASIVTAYEKGFSNNTASTSPSLRRPPGQ